MPTGSQRLAIRAETGRHGNCLRSDQRFLDPTRRDIDQMDPRLRQLLHVQILATQHIRRQSLRDNCHPLAVWTEYRLTYEQPLSFSFLTQL